MQSTSWHNHHHHHHHYYYFCLLVSFHFNNNSKNVSTFFLFLLLCLRVDDRFIIINLCVWTRPPHQQLFNTDTAYIYIRALTINKSIWIEFVYIIIIIIIIILVKLVCSEEKSIFFLLLRVCEVIIIIDLALKWFQVSCIRSMMWRDYML